MANRLSHLPDSEARRVYFKRLVKEVQLVCGVDAATARQSAEIMLTLLQRKVVAGESIDLGFLVLSATSVKPATYTTRFKKGDEDSGTYFTGHTLRWKASLRKSWLRKARPRWSRH